MVLTNIYPIENLNQLQCKYRLYRIRGLPPDVDEYDRNLQILEDKLSRSTQSPCERFTKNGEIFIAQPEGHRPPQKSLPIVGAYATIEPTDQVGELRLDNLARKDEADLGRRFLDFYMQSPLYDSPLLWQPGSGRPFFNKTPDLDFRRLESTIDMYAGFRVKSILLHSGGIGLCVDPTRKFIERNFLPPRISRNEFESYRDRNCLYQYGDRWYEIQLDGRNDQPVRNVMLPSGTSLYDDIKTRSHQGSYLSPDSTALTYHTGLGELRHAPSQLCRLTVSTGHAAVKRWHKETIVSPAQRFDETEFVVRNNLAHLRFINSPITLSTTPLELETQVAPIPPLMFGNGAMLTVGDQEGCSLEQFGRKKRELLYAGNAGPFVRRELDRQYLVMPKSISESWGPKFVEDIEREIHRLETRDQRFNYLPQILYYDDAVRPSVASLGEEILRTVEGGVSFGGGFGLVMIPRLPRRTSNAEDELANLVMRELRKLELYVSICHTEVPSESYQPVARPNGTVGWEMTSHPRSLSRYRGYISNVVLNKILILNSCWPFVLSEPLHADLTVGIDVKGNTAGFMVIPKDGKSFRFTFRRSDQRERLSKGLISKTLQELLRDELEPNGQPRTLLFIRDGRLWPGESSGIDHAASQLARDGYVGSDYDCNMLEFQKNLSIPIRLFEKNVPSGSQRQVIDNPTVGTHAIFGDTAYICTTGYPFHFEGTSRPVKIVKHSGSMSMREIVDDTFAQANLTFTRVDYCSRYPLAIKMADIRLREFAGDYDEDELQYGEEEEEGILA